MQCVFLEDGTFCRNYEYWSDSKIVGTRGNERRAPAHKNFDDQMVKKRLLTGLVKH